MKTKRKTLSDISSLFNYELNDKILERFNSEVPCEAESYEPFGVYIRTYDSGESKKIVRCTKCKNTFSKEDDYEYSCNCPNCGENLSLFQYGSSKYAVGNRYNILNKHNYVYVYPLEDDIFAIAEIQTFFQQEKNEQVFYEANGDNAFLDTPITAYRQIYRIQMFCSKFGLRHVSFSYGCIIQKGGSSISISNNVIKNDGYNKIMQIIQEKIPAENCEERTFSEIFYRYNQAIKPSNKKNPSIVTDEDDIFLELTPISQEEIKKDVKTFSDMFENTPTLIEKIDGNNMHYFAMCACGHIFDSYTEINNTFDIYETYSVENTCPCCNKKTTFDLRGVSKNAPTKKRTIKYQKLGDNIIGRVFEITHSFELEKKVGSIAGTEVKRFIFSPKKIQVFETNSIGNWKKSTIKNLYISNADRWYGPGPSASVLNTEKELEELISNSFLNKTGLLQAWGLGEYSDFKIESPGTISPQSFLTQWYKKPYLEFTEKSKLLRATKTLMFTSVIENYKDATDIYNLLDITKAVFRIARKRDLDIAEIKRLKKCYQLQSNFSLKQYDELQLWFNRDEHDIVCFEHFLNACEETNTSISRMKEYLQSCYDNQCILRREALSIYRDYYKMAKKIGFNISDNSIKFPNSLKKEHDKATFAYKVVENEIKKKLFHENSTINKKYEYSSKNLMVIVPTEPDEVIREGQMQKHCVSTYVSRIENGSTCICFIRKKDDIDTPYFTCEILKDTIYQVKGFCNHYPDKKDDKELIEFIEKWAKAKTLRIDYMNH